MLIPDHIKLQQDLYSTATKLAADSKEFAHLIRSMDPEYAARLKVFVRELPEEVAKSTLYGRAHWIETRINKKKRTK